MAGWFPMRRQREGAGTRRELPCGMAADSRSAAASAARHRLCRELLRRAWLLADLDFFFKQLLSMQHRVVASMGQQLFMRSTLDDLTAIQNDNFICVLYSGHAMADQNRCPSSHDVLELVENLLFGVRVNAR